MRRTSCRCEVNAPIRSVRPKLLLISLLSVCACSTSTVGLPPELSCREKNISSINFFKRGGLSDELKQLCEIEGKHCSSSLQGQWSAALHLFVAPSCMCEDEMWNMAPSCDQTLTLDQKLWRSHDSDAVQIVHLRQLPLSFLGSVSHSFPSTSTLCTLTSP